MSSFPPPLGYGSLCVCLPSSLCQEAFTRQPVITWAEPRLRGQTDGAREYRGGIPSWLKPSRAREGAAAALTNTAAHAGWRRETVQVIIRGWRGRIHDSIRITSDITPRVVILMPCLQKMASVRPYSSLHKSDTDGRLFTQLPLRTFLGKHKLVRLSAFPKRRRKKRGQFILWFPHKFCFPALTCHANLIMTFVTAEN